MQVNIIQTSDPDLAMRMSLGGVPNDQHTMSFFQQNYQNFMSSMKNHADGFVNAVSNIYHYFTNNDIIDKAKRALTSNENMIEDKYVHFVNNVTVYQPGMTMRRYMMAEPKVYDMYTNNLCSGYNDEFVNEEQDLKPTLRDDYLHVMDGYVNDKYTMFYDDENPLSIRDRFIVQDAWDTMRELMSYGYDPTSPEQDKL